MKAARLRAAAIVALAIAMSAASGARATDLLEAWAATRQHAPALAAARAAMLAGETLRAQASALQRPTVFAQASVGLMSASTTTHGAQFGAPGFGQSAGVSFGTSIQGDIGMRWSVGMRQAIIHRERDAQQEQLRIGADASALQWRAAQQQLMLELAYRYFDLTLADQQLALLESQSSAVDRAWAEARDRFEIGDVPATDTHEAAARARALQAQLLAARNRLVDAQAALADLSGLAATSLRALPPGTQVAPERLVALDVWLALAEQSNPAVLMARAGAASADQEMRRQIGAASPTVEFVAQAAREQLSGSGSFGPASNSQNQQMLGLTVSLPLYTGGLREAREQQARELSSKARAELELARQQTAAQVRSEWLALQSGPARLEALEAAVTASQARLEATRLGRQVGDRTTQDLLNAENDASANAFSLLQARVGILLGSLRLEALAGRLDADQFRSVDRTLRR